MREFLDTEVTGGLVLPAATVLALLWPTHPGPAPIEALWGTELAVGEQRSARNAALPALAALGGMVLPALLFLTLNLGGEGQRGWGVPMATDIVFAPGVLVLFAARVPSGLKLLL